MSENHDWPNCGQVQCKQSHELAQQVLLYLGEECPDDIYIVGKMGRICQAIDKLRASQQPTKITSEQFIAYWDSLTFEQHCLLAAQSLLRAAALTKDV